MKENVIGRLLDTTFGFRGRQNLLAWAVAGGLAYYLFYLPEQRKAEEHRVLYEQKRRHYEEKGLWDVDKVRPIPDKQQNGLVIGSRPQPAAQPAAGTEAAVPLAPSSSAAAAVAASAAGADGSK